MWQSDMIATLETGEIPGARSTVGEGVGCEDISDPFGDWGTVLYKLYILEMMYLPFWLFIGKATDKQCMWM